MEEKYEEQNRAYWRACLFIIDDILETAFKRCYINILCSFPSLQLHMRPFVYNAQLKVAICFRRFSVNLKIRYPNY